MKTRIILVGTGYVSIWCYKYLMRNAGKQIKRGLLEVVILSPTDFHAFHGFTGEFLNGYLDLAHRSSPIQKIAPHATLIAGKLTGVNHHTQKLTYLPNGQHDPLTLDYDHVVIGIGTQDNFSLVPGMREFGLSVKREGGLAECRARIHNCISKATKEEDPAVRKSLLSFTVVGGGFAGVEVCGNLVEYLKALRETYPILAIEGFQVNLVYASDDILPQMGNRFHLMRNYCRKTLDKLGVQRYSNARLTSIEENSVQLHSLQTIRTSTVICAVGQQHIKLPNSSLSVSPQGSLIADAFLRAENTKNVWVGGDAAQVARPSGKEKYCRYDALWAIKHGTRIGKNLARIAKGRKPRKFSYPGLGQTASVYQGKAILELYGLQLVGPLAWISRIGFFLYFYPNKREIPSILKSLFGKRVLGNASSVEKTEPELILTA